MNNQWWGYLHTNGSIQVKRFFSNEDLEEAWASPFVEDLVMPFEAESREDALAQAKMVLSNKHVTGFLGEKKK